MLDGLRGKVDAVISDPPYGMSWDTNYTHFPSIRGKNRNYPRIEGDDKPFDPAPLLRFPVVALFGFNHYSDKLPRGSLLVWVKRRDSMLGKWMSDAEIVWLSKGTGVYILQHEWHGALKASERGQRCIHPTQKPVEVMKWVIERAGIKAGQTVLDPFCGSGATGVACVDLGINFIGIEKSREHANNARERVARALELKVKRDSIPA